ncbi:polyketide synthase [Xylariomycetidae sp. FL2044]|nr:polyketide synthase [Xylariomycetidae sp. FL2044]
MSGYLSVKRIFKSTTPVIPSVIQDAMLLKDELFENMDVDDFPMSIPAKVQDVGILHRASLKLLKHPLDFFAILSSISVFVGWRGQANSTDANTVLNAFASYRQG